MGKPRSSAVRFTGEAATSMPRPLALSGWVTTSFTLNPASTSFSSVGTANIGVPQKTRSITAALPFTQLCELADLALDQVAFKRADMADIELAVEVVGLMQQGTCQQLFAGHLKAFALQVLGPSGDFPRTCDFLAKLRQTQASFVGGDPAFHVNNFRIDQHDLGLWIFLEGDVDDRDAFADADLRRGQAHAVRGIHAFEHVVRQLAQLIVELGNRGRRLLQYRVSELDDWIDHLEVS